MQPAHGWSAGIEHVVPHHMRGLTHLANRLLLSRLNASWRSNCLVSFRREFL